MNLINWLATLSRDTAISFHRLPVEGKSALAGSSFATSMGGKFCIAPGKASDLAALVRGVVCAPLLPDTKPLPHMSAQEKAYLKLLRAFSHGVTAIDIAGIRTSLVHKGVIKADSRDTSHPSRKQRFFVKKPYRSNVDRA